MLLSPLAYLYLSASLLKLSIKSYIGSSRDSEIDSALTSIISIKLIFSYSIISLIELFEDIFLIKLNKVFIIYIISY